jgi:signal transduction histidine kinase
VILERILVNGRSQALSPGGILKLGPGTKSLDFEFTAISFTAPQKVRFRHKLENFDADWVESDVARRAHYGPLPAGQYRFRVIAANAEKVWNENGAALGVIVTPPIWRAWWFLTLLGAATAASIWAAARYISTRRLEARLRAAEQQHAMERERARIARDMHDEIGSKLTRISFLSEVARHSGAQTAASTPPVEAIASTSRELLQSLDEIVWAVNPRNDNLEQLAGYLEQHAREYFQGTNCECRIAVPAQLPEAPLSAELRHNVFLAFEEALNNSLKHAGAHNVAVDMTVNHRWFEVRVQDDGRGFDPDKTTGPQEDGLRNMRERLEGIGGICEITSRPGAGTVVAFRFPLARVRRTGTLSTETSYLKK